MENRTLSAVFSIILLSILSFGHVHAQETKHTEATRTAEMIKIDGRLSESAWNEASAATGFVTYSPTIGEKALNQTVVKVLYDDNALYIGAQLSNNSATEIPTGLCGRDEVTMNADYFHVSLTPFNDGQNMYEFVVSSANVQVDQKLVTHNMEDYHADTQTQGHSGSNGQSQIQGRSERLEKADIEWDAVWDSEVEVTGTGWNVELRIPYAAIRFPKEQEMTWGINFWRVDRANKETSTWNLVDRAKNGIANQQGNLVNINQINSPIRLELRPYLSVYAENYSENNKTETLFNGGLDLKYGINESFTLDMMLIPDFGQTTSDNLVLNLTAHETKYSEKRQFFTEGTELFEKAGLFYSRRIGDAPEGFHQAASSLEEGEKLVSNPSETGVINATKISGRTNSGLGIGFFNAMTQNTYATIEDSLGIERRIKTEPFANYNIAVIDQSFGQYSYLNVINLNKYVPENKSYSNVSGSAFKFTDKKNRYGIYGTGAVSLVNSHTSDSDVSKGGYLNMNMGKISGQFQYIYNFELISDQFDPNAMGYFTLKNELNHNLVLRYSMFQPRGKFLAFNTSLQSTYKSLYDPNTFTEAKFLLSANGVLRNMYTIGGDMNVKPLGVKDYYEPRVPGRFYQRPASYKISFFVVSDYRKSFTWNTRFSFKDEQGRELYFGITPGIRLNNKLSFNYSVDAWQTNDDIGYITTINTDSIVFGQRTVKGSSQSVTGQYSFNNKSILNLKVRYYHSTVDYNTTYLLNED
ncbi:MAG: carbohydrate binding family 9 domain-containing protein, partial [Bacteroidales bacterium]|nr:carbohydrate binding family 9 domain-containing protein [Bacteroidales bacterium]